MSATLTTRPFVTLTVVTGITMASGFLATVAHAAPPDDPAITDKARALYIEGSRLLDEERWAECRTTLLAAWLLKQQHQIAGNLGVCEEKLALYAEAANHLRAFLDGLPAHASAERRAIGETLYAQVRSKVGSLIVSVDVPGAEIWVDGTSSGRTPLDKELFIEAGGHRIELKLQGYETNTREFIILAGETKNITIELKKPQSIHPAERPPIPTALSPLEPWKPAPAKPLWPAVASIVVMTSGFFIGAGFYVASMKTSRPENDRLATGGIAATIVGIAGLITFAAYAIAPLPKSTQSISAHSIQFVPAFSREGIGVLGALSF
jgi:PEGA domain